MNNLKLYKLLNRISTVLSVVFYLMIPFVGKDFMAALFFSVLFIYLIFQPLLIIAASILDYTLKGNKERVPGLILVNGVLYGIVVFAIIAIATSPMPHFG